MSPQAKFLGAKGWLSRPERLHLRDAARRTVRRFGPVTVMVNIGVEYGASLHCLRAGAPLARIFGIDLDNSKLVGDPGAVLITGHSHEVSRRFKNNIALLFVDGGHDYATVMGDIIHWTPKVMPGGLVLFHDFSTRPQHEGVRLAVERWINSWTGGWTQTALVDTLIEFTRDADLLPLSQSEKR